MAEPAEKERAAIAAELTEKGRAERNRTVRLTKEEREAYLCRCLKKESLAGNRAGGPVAGERLAGSVILGDCFEILPLLPDKFVDLMIADPPYNLDKTYGSGKFRKMAVPEYEAFTRRWLEEALHTLKDTASVYICCDWKSSLIIGRVLSDYLQVQNRITWQREKGRGAFTNWKNSMEDIWFAVCTNTYTFNAEAVKQRRLVRAPYREGGRPKDWQERDGGKYRDTYSSNFWDDVSVPFWSMPENTDHPAQKPEKLLAKLILASSCEGDVVFDPFAGTGTSAVAAKKLKRQYLAIEKEPEYCALAEKRLEIAGKDASIQGYADNVFWERNSRPGQKKAVRGDDCKAKRSKEE